MRIVIVGGVAAGMSAASRARRQDPEAQIVVFERGDWISYGACGLPYVLGGDVKDFDALVARTPAQMRARGIGVRLGHEVTGVDSTAATITVQDRVSGQTLTEPYDRLLLATGVSALRPDWAQTDLSGVHFLREIPDGQAIEASLKGARRACVVGAGYIGIEMADALRARGLSVVLLEKAPEVAGRMLDPEYQRLVRAELEQHDVDVRCNTGVVSLTGRDGRVTGVQTEDGLVRADLVIVAVGIQPRTELARAAGVRLGKSGAVAVNARQETNVPGIYSAGDNTECIHRVTRRKVHIPLALSANRMGRVAGVNMAGGDARFPGVAGTGIFKVFELGAARTGLTQTDADTLGLNAVSVDVKSTDHAGYYRDAQPIFVRLTGERGSGRLLGAQLVGCGDSVKRVDVVAALLHRRASVQDLFESDLAYAPPYSGVWDVLLVAADRLSREL
ncbi:FAD-dependent oxidoreductase [Deinococcus deserti]|uniref:Putative Coenzyme A disulfide reductase (CoA-disulfide reductase) (CoADR) n=1 Tax=Deinococcus deserti (strain DSM 17065 / CIP 109153 / LMG 22923 / VCD115) TaxID=546414 RepID=C1CUJ7_DEIDV|nr:FAD-dependent oxidoreductase [Deinococcus deserti]ACO45864.1 putative Coenzyme A disulfide reductase (CoA-disulfide reductase) (CoADR) [Deinococcus deserti VCD115]